jgi:hypothetical protein
MTREDVKKQFPDATEEQITALLNQHNSEIQSEKNKAAKNDDEIKRLKGVEKELSDLKNQNLTDAEKLEQEKAETEAERVKLKKMQNRIEVEKILVAAGLSEDDYKEYIDGLVSDDLDASTKLANGIVGTLKTKVEKAGKDKENQLLDDLDDDKGSGGGKDKDPEKSEAEKFAEAHAQKVSGNGDLTTNVLKNYLGGNE